MRIRLRSRLKTGTLTLTLIFNSYLPPQREKIHFEMNAPMGENGPVERAMTEDNKGF